MHTHTRRRYGDKCITSVSTSTPASLLGQHCPRDFICVHPSTSILLRCRLYQTPILSWKAIMIIGVIYNLKHLLSPPPLLNFYIDRSVPKSLFVYNSNIVKSPHHRSCDSSIADPPVGSTWRAVNDKQQSLTTSTWIIMPFIKRKLQRSEDNDILNVRFT